MSAAPHVVIVGGGLSGLSCADALLRQSSLASGLRVRVTVLESNGRLGGRTVSARCASAGASVDLGGQWLGPAQSRALALARELGLTLLPQFCSGKRVIEVGARLRTYAGLIPDLGVLALVDAQLALLLIGVLQWAAWCGCATRALDSCSMAALTARCMWTAGGRALVRIIVQAFFGAEPEAVSVLAFCRYVSASGGVERMSEIGPGSLQAWTLAGGAGALAAGLAARVRAAGGDVRTGARVEALEAAGGGAGVALALAAGAAAVADADAVVLALPPPLAAGLRFAPALPAARAHLAATAAMGCITKLVLVYRRAFWRDAGFSGECVADARADAAGGPAFNLFDGCAPVDGGAPAPDDDAATAAAAAAADARSHYVAPALRAWVAAGRPAAGAPDIEWVDAPPGVGGKMLPALVAFINGERAAAWSARGADARREAVTRQIQRWFGGDAEALAPLEVLECDWKAHPHTRGCPTAVYALGALAGAGGPAARLAAPDWPARAGGHLLHWAGTETAARNTGFMCGALDAGARAAEDVVADLRQRAAAVPPQVGSDGARAAVAPPPPPPAAAAAAAEALRAPLL
jgi:monoamine oxidase